MSEKGLKENALFGLPPRERKLCGLGNTPSILRRFLTTGNSEGVESEFESFKNLPNHLQSIALRLNKDKYSLTVAQEYWFKEHNRTVLNSPGADDLTAVNLCFIRPGRIISIQDTSVLVDALVLKSERNCLTFTTEKQTVSFDPDITDKLSPGQAVALHWGKVVKALNSAEERTLTTHTLQVVRQSR